MPVSRLRLGCGRGVIPLLLLLGRWLNGPDCQTDVDSVSVSMTAFLLSHPLRSADVSTPISYGGKGS